jgi:hypothetical protein
VLIAPAGPPSDGLQGTDRQVAFGYGEPHSGPLVQGRISALGVGTLLLHLKHDWPTGQYRWGVIYTDQCLHVV